MDLVFICVVGVHPLCVQRDWPVILYYCIPVPWLAFCMCMFRWFGCRSSWLCSHTMTVVPLLCVRVYWLSFIMHVFALCDWHSPDMCSYYLINVLPWFVQYGWLTLAWHVFYCLVNVQCVCVLVSWLSFGFYGFVCHGWHSHEIVVHHYDWHSTCLCSQVLDCRSRQCVRIIWLIWLSFFYSVFRSNDFHSHHMCSKVWLALSGSMIQIAGWRSVLVCSNQVTGILVKCVHFRWLTILGNEFLSIGFHFFACVHLIG